MYKYGVYKIVLQELYPRYTEYKIKKVFDELLDNNYISKVECNKSFKYQFNGHNIYNCKKKNENDTNGGGCKYDLNENGSVILYFD